MDESSKSMLRRLHDSRFATRYFVGEGVDIGAGPDPLTHHAEFFPLMRSLMAWDTPQGDAQFMATIPDERFDFVHSSHCLEHLVDPAQGLLNWFRILKPGGHLVVMVPDEDLYEQGEFPSTYNTDHKSTFTIAKQKSWSKASVNLIDLIAGLGEAAQIVRIELLDASYRYRFPRYDQTQTALGESAIEMIVRKRPRAEINAGGRLPARR